MQRHNRRLSPTPRTYRHTRVPAYKVRRPGRPAEPDGLATTTADTPVTAEAVPTTNGLAGIDAVTAAEIASLDAPTDHATHAAIEAVVLPLDTPFDALDPEPVGEAFIGPLLVEEVGAVPETPAVEDVPASAVADSPPAQSHDPHDTTTDLDYAGYLQSIEAAAARSRAELRGRVVPRMRPAAVAPVWEVPAMVAAPAPTAVAAPGEGGFGPPTARTTNDRNDRGRRKDPRPRLKRPKTWFAIAAMLPLVASIGLLIYFGNIAKKSFDAYNQINVDSTPRPVYQINPKGTPEIVPTEQVAELLPDWDKKDKVNILLLGIDPRPDELEPPRSDTVIVVHVDPEAGTITMMSIPRDVWVYIPGFDEDKINAAYPLGEANADSVPGGGPSLVAQTIEANFGIPIHYFATVDFDGFREIVDTIGGVFIDVPSSIKDDLYPTEDYGVTRVYFPTGLQKMDGETALRYSRTRHGDNDISRGDRQQQVLRAIREQAMTLGLITRASDLIGEIGDSVRTDLNFNQMLALANLGRNISGDNIRTINLWEMGLLYEHDPEFEGDAFYFEGDWEGIHQVMADLFAVAPPPTPTPEPTATPTAEPTEEPTEEPTVVATEFAAEPTATTDEGSPTETSEADATATATATTSTVPVPGPGVDLALPVVVQNSSGIGLLATDSVTILANAGFSEVYADSTDLPEPTTVIYDNIGSPDTALYIAELLGLPPSAIQPSNGGTAILVVLGQDVPVDVLRP